MTLIGPGTWEAARGAADAALTAADARRGRDARRLRLLAPARPPRHARRLRRLLLPQQRAVAASRLREALAGPVAMIDVDAHHGNGAQSIFAERTDVLTGSVHVDPAAGWFPHFLGHAGETCGGATATCRSRPGAGDARMGRGRAALARWARGPAPRAWSSRSASTPRAATPRARSRSPRTATATRAASSAGSGSRP